VFFVTFVVNNPWYSAQIRPIRPIRVPPLLSPTCNQPISAQPEMNLTVAAEFVTFIDLRNFY